MHASDVARSTAAADAAPGGGSALFAAAAAAAKLAAAAATFSSSSAALRAALMLMLRNAGFSAVQESALTLLADVTADRLGKLGTTLRQLTDASARAGLEAMPGMLRANDGYVSPEEARDCMRQHGVHWQRFAACTAAAVGDGAAETQAHKRPCLMER